jgi:hypothetical protein
MPRMLRLRSFALPIALAVLADGAPATAVFAGHSHGEPSVGDLLLQRGPAPDSQLRPRMGAGMLRGGEEAYAAYSSRASAQAQCTSNDLCTRARRAGMRSGSRHGPGRVRAMRQPRPAGRDECTAKGRLRAFATLAAPGPDTPRMYRDIFAHVFSIFHEPADASVTPGPQSRPGLWARLSGLQSPGGSLPRTCVRAAFAAQMRGPWVPTEAASACGRALWSY